MYYEINYNISLKSLCQSVERKDIHVMCTHRDERVLKILRARININNIYLVVAGTPIMITIRDNNTHVPDNNSYINDKITYKRHNKNTPGVITKFTALIPQKYP